MRHQIIEKLGQHLQDQEFSLEIWSESLAAETWIVYLLAQIRKIIGSDGYPTLRLYCDWVLHTKLTGKLAKDKIDILNFSPDSTEVAKFLSFHALHEELEGFLCKQELPSSVADNDRWFEFRSALIRILTDQPLENDRGADIVRISLVKDSTIPKGYGHFFINFEAVNRDGDVIPIKILTGDQGGGRRERIEKNQQAFWERWFIKKFGSIRGRDNLK